MSICPPKCPWRPGPAVFIIAVAAIFVSVSSLGAETKFSGELKPEVIFNIPGSRGYTDTPLNPNNEWGIDDLMFRNQIDLKVESSGETAAMDLWFQVNQYPISDLLIGSAGIAEALGGPAGYSTAVADLFYVADPYIFSLDILRASVSWSPADSLKMTFGRQSFLTGYGYGWNPVDLANPPKDPTDPGAYVRGVDALTIQFDPSAWLTVKAYGALPSPGFAWGYEDVLTGAEITVYTSIVEIMLAGLWGGAESSGDEYDAYPHAGALGFFLDLAGVGVYGEGSLRSRSRRNLAYADGSGTEIAGGPVFTALAGLEYYFPSGLAASAEYFYNGEGWTASDRRDYVAGLEALASGDGITGEFSALYTPTYFARHYILANLTIPWYAIEATFNINAIISPDSGALMLTPNASFNLNYEGTLVSEIWYSGRFSLYDGDNEADLAPAAHSAWLNFRYYF
jgi:hypothetical protein